MNIRSIALFLMLMLAADMTAQRSETADSLTMKGDSCMTQYDYFHALSYYEQAATAGSATALPRMGYCYYKRGNYGKCIELLEPLFHVEDSVRPLGHEELRALYESYQKQGRKDDMYACGRHIIKQHPFDSEIVADMARNYNADDDPAKAFVLTASYLSKDDDNMLVAKQYADACFLNMSFTLAKHYYHRLLDMGDNSFDVVYSLGMCYYQAEHYDTAYVYLKRAAELKNYQYTECLYRLGISAIHSGHPDDGIFAIQKALELSIPSSKLLCYLYETLADGYEKAGNDEECLEALKLAQLQEGANNAKLQFKLAVAYQRCGQSLSARYAYEQFLQMAHMIDDEKKPDELKTMIRQAEIQIETLKDKP